MIGCNCSIDLPVFCDCLIATRFECHNLLTLCFALCRGLIQFRVALTRSCGQFAAIINQKKKIYGFQKTQATNLGLKKTQATNLFAAGCPTKSSLTIIHQPRHVRTYPQFEAQEQSAALSQVALSLYKHIRIFIPIHNLVYIWYMVTGSGPDHAELTTIDVNRYG